MSNKPFLVYVVEDDEWYNKLLVHQLQLNPDFEVKAYTDGASFLADLDKGPQVVTLDYRLPDMDGMTLLQKIKAYNDQIPVIVISEQEAIETAVDLLKAGAYEYLVKSKDIRDRLLNTINHIRKNNQLQQRVAHLEKEVRKKYDVEHSIIGDSPALKKVFDLIEKAITTNITVSITGETGTGKELVAKAIHYNSKRKNKPLVAVNMAAIPSELIESELFGHEKGAFTGASFQRTGKFEEANGGSLFLDEMGEMDIVMQAKLLRVLQEKEVTRVGSNKPISIDCRIIVATHKNLQEEVKAGRFREDLYFRLFGLPIHLPPLRDRGKDILILAKFFISQFCKDNDLEPKVLTNEAQKKLLQYAFPGNIRELKSIVELSAVMANTNEIDSQDIILSTDDPVVDIISQELTLREYDMRILQTFLLKYDNDIKKVAGILDISQSTIYRMLKEQEGDK